MGMITTPTELAQDAIENYGGTYAREGGGYRRVTLAAGYFVGGYGECFNGVETDELAAHLAGFDPAGSYLGVWNDGGIWCLDATKVHFTRDHAIAEARANGQRAIWSIADGEEIPL
jgi:hypothetical protein